jgi:hypothetical protein
MIEKGGGVDIVAIYNEWMNEWMNELKWNEWMKWNNEWMIGWTNKRMNERTNEWMNERTNERMNERTYARPNSTCLLRTREPVRGRVKRPFLPVQCARMRTYARARARAHTHAHVLLLNTVVSLTKAWNYEVMLNMICVCLRELRQSHRVHMEGPVRGLELPELQNVPWSLPYAELMGHKTASCIGLFKHRVMMAWRVSDGMSPLIIDIRTTLTLFIRARPRSPHLWRKRGLYPPNRMLGGPQSRSPCFGKEKYHVQIELRFLGRPACTLVTILTELSWFLTEAEMT